MKNTFKLTISLIILAISVVTIAQPGTKETNDKIRARQIKEMKFGMFICWSFSTFSGQEWTPTEGKDPSYFKATGCDTDQWCKVAKDAGMGYILFLTKHHDGFCLWDTRTTGKKVTNSPLGIDVMEKLRKSCDKYGIKLAIYFSEGDWTFPGASFSKSGGTNPDVKKEQLKELLTNYGPIEYIWFDHAQGDGGLSHEETVKWVARFQPDCLPGFNHGTPAGRIRIGELGKPSAIDDISGAGYNKDAAGYKGYIAAEFTYPILPPHEGGAMWFYSLPKHDNLCLPAEKIYSDYLGAVKFGNIFSLDVGPDYSGRIRAIDERTLQQVGNFIRTKYVLPDNWSKDSINQYKVK
jgi:alpha-L-fucosidase